MSLSFGCDTVFFQKDVNHFHFHIFLCYDSILRHGVTVLLDGVHFGGKMNCLAELCVGIADCARSFEKVTFAILQNAS